MKTAALPTTAKSILLQTSCNIYPALKAITYFKKTIVFIPVRFSTYCKKESGILIAFGFNNLILMRKGLSPYASIVRSRQRRRMLGIFIFLLCLMFLYLFISSVHGSIFPIF
jgi:hypothetical protein